MTPSTINWDEDKLRLSESQIIPSEDIEIYLSALYGEADCLVSSNRKLRAQNFAHLIVQPQKNLLISIEKNQKPIVEIA